MEHAMTQSRFLSLSCVAGMSALVLMSGAAFAADISLAMDQVRVVTFRTPFKAVSVGNPLIADATVIDETHVFLVGKEFGTTNLVAVDDEGNQVAEEMITVSTQRGAMVTVTRGALAQTLTCNAGRCDVRPTPGDEPARYRDDSTAITIREGQNVGAASVPSQ
jgi:Flp pilus assembly secretin CpaC